MSDETHAWGTMAPGERCRVQEDAGVYVFRGIGDDGAARVEGPSGRVYRVEPLRLAPWPGPMRVIDGGAA